MSNYVSKYCCKPAQLASPAELRVNQFVAQGLIPGTFFLMSHGIGEGYVKRMKRYHRASNIRSPSERISVVVDRAHYHDGAFKYKLPRYFKDRLYRKKFPCDAKVWNPKLKKYEEKIIYRYKSKNPLAIQMQVEIRNRFLAEYNRRFTELKLGNPDLSDTQVHQALLLAEKSASLSRQKDIYSKMSRFYQSNRFKNRKL